MTPPTASGRDSEFAAAARLLARRLELLALVDGDGSPVWEGDDVDPAAAPGPSAVPALRHGRLDEGLLTGRVGIALALAAAARLPGGSPSWAGLAVRAASAAVGVAAADGTGVGWDSGALGIAQAAAVVARLLRAPTLEAAARRLTAVTLRRVLDDPDVLPPWPDLLGGLAGVLSATQCAPLDPGGEPVRLEVTRLLATRLADLAQAGDGVRGWAMATSSIRVVGLAHGQSGVALALVLAARGLRSGGSGTAGSGLADRLETLAREGLTWEDGQYDAHLGGWPDLRTAGGVPGLAWCHGALGLGVVAALMARGGGPLGEWAHATFLRARSASEAHRPVGDGVFDGSLCHGFGGVVELHLAGAATWSGSAADHLRIARQAALHLTRAGQPGHPAWGCGLPGGGRTPNALAGIAGVALTLARCHDPGVAPAVADPTLGRLHGW